MCSSDLGRWRVGRQEIQRLQRQIQREQSIREAGREGGCPKCSAPRVGSVGAERGADEKATRLREKEEVATLKGHLKRQEENYRLFRDKIEERGRGSQHVRSRDHEEPIGGKVPANIGDLVRSEVTHPKPDEVEVPFPAVDLPSFTRSGRRVKPRRILDLYCGLRSPRPQGDRVSMLS